MVAAFATGLVIFALAGAFYFTKQEE